MAGPGCHQQLLGSWKLLQPGPVTDGDEAAVSEESPWLPPSEGKGNSKQWPEPDLEGDFLQRRKGGPSPRSLSLLCPRRDPLMSMHERTEQAGLSNSP